MIFNKLFKNSAESPHQNHYEEEEEIKQIDEVIEEHSEGIIEYDN